jgi:hypothetical protein
MSEGTVLVVKSASDTLNLHLGEVYMVDRVQMCNDRRAPKWGVRQAGVEAPLGEFREVAYAVKFVAALEASGMPIARQGAT